MVRSTIRGAGGDGRARASTGVVRRRRGEEGYNLVMLIVIITILNVMVAVALPMWSYVIRRDREEETIFRGLQYAEAIRVFRQRNGRYPTALEELIKVEPRSIRQLWTEPLSKDGEFGLLVEMPQQAPSPPGSPPAAPGTPGAAPTPGPVPVEIPGGVRPGTNTGGLGIGGQFTPGNLFKLPRAAKNATGDTVGKTVTTGPLAIHGVYLDREGESLRKFFGKDKYEQWTFAAEMITPPVSAPGRPLPRVRDDWLGKTFAEGLSPALGSGTGPYGSPPPGTDLGGKPLVPGQVPGGTKGKPSDRPKPEPGTPSEFPEDVPPDVPDDTMHSEEPPEAPDEEPPPDEEPAPDEPQADPGNQGDQGLR